MNVAQHLTTENQTEQDANNRQQALTNQSFIVEAPAGAGKTELLTQRFLKLLQTVQAPEEIIAITFTNKAASEMRSRIMDSLTVAASGTEPELPHKKITFDLGVKALTRSAELDWKLLETPSRLRIYTIDSLSGNLARQMPLLSRFGTQPAVRDDASAYYLEAATQTLAHLETDGISEVIQAALRYFDNDTYKLTQLLAKMLAKRDQWLPYSQSNNTAETAEAALSHLINQELQAAANQLNEHIQSTLMPIARYAADNLAEGSTIKALQNWQAPLAPDVTQLPQWLGLADLLLTGGGSFRKRFDKNMGLPAEKEAKPFKDALAEAIAQLQQTAEIEQCLAKVRALPDTKDSQPAWKMVATLSQLLHVAVGELWLVFQSHGEVDFVEISQRSLLALEDIEGNTTDLALKLDYRIQHLLVDEFQDTSPTQIKLISALTRGWQADDGRTLFAVGDPMQSIYRFRKANVGLFLRAAEKGIGSLKLTPLKLWRNNRSSPEVIQWVNEAFQVIFPKQDSSTHGAIQYRPFVATKPNDKSAGVFVHALLNDQPNKDDESESALPNNVRQQEADRIIKIIQDTWQQDSTRKIAVLVRARSHLHALVTEIRRNHPSLDFQAVEIEELANRQIVQDLLSLTHALHHRADRLHWLAILRAPWCGLTLADLHALVADDQYSTVLQLLQDKSRLKTLSKDGQSRVTHFVDVIKQVLAQQGRTSVRRWIHGAWLMLGGAQCLWESNDIQDVQAFFDRIQQLEQAKRFSLESLMLEVQKLYAAPNAKAPDTLQFMTIHKSKGLEFDTVILPGLDRKTGNDDQSLLLWEEVPISERSTQENSDIVELVAAPLIPKGQHQQANVTPYDYLKSREKQRAEYENTRVLYVAATRAERCLHLIGAANIDSKTEEAKAPANTFLAMLWPIVHNQFTPEHVIKPTKVLTDSHADLHDFVPQLIRLKQPKITEVFAQKQHDTTNYNAVNESEDIDTLDADVGILSHLYMQIAADKELGHWNASYINSLKPAMQRWFKQQYYATAICEQAAERVATLLHTAFNSEQGQWVLKARASAKNELAIEVSNNDTATKKVVDRTFIENGTRWIVDYKSVALAANTTKAGLSAVAEHYREQLEAYEKLFEDEGLPIQKAIFFISVGKLITL